MVVSREQPFDQDTMSYFEYLRRYRRTEQEKRIHFDTFCLLTRSLAEGEFLLAAMTDQDKKGSTIYRKLLRDQGKLRKQMLISNKPEEEPEEFDVNGPEETPAHPTNPLRDALGEDGVT